MNNENLHPSDCMSNKGRFAAECVIGTLLTTPLIILGFLRDGVDRNHKINGGDVIFGSAACLLIFLCGVILLRLQDYVKVKRQAGAPVNAAIRVLFGGGIISAICWSFVGFIAMSILGLVWALKDI
ncbi:MAG: hypothetical protein AAF532_09805 [Planctomycetota bacterium]